MRVHGDLITLDNQRLRRPPSPQLASPGLRLKNLLATLNLILLARDLPGRREQEALSHTKEEKKK
jgi:hypothetical protein